MYVTKDSLYFREIMFDSWVKLGLLVRELQNIHFIRKIAKLLDDLLIQNSKSVCQLSHDDCARELLRRRGVYSRSLKLTRGPRAACGTRNYFVRPAALSMNLKIFRIKTTCIIHFTRKKSIIRLRPLFTYIYSAFPLTRE